MITNSAASTTNDKAKRVPIDFLTNQNDAVPTELPFVVGLITDLSGSARPGLPGKRVRLVHVTLSNFEAVLKSLNPAVSVRLPASQPCFDQGAGNTVELTFESLQDFTPERLLLQLPVYDALAVRSALLAHTRTMNTKLLSTNCTRADFFSESGTHQCPAWMFQDGLPALADEECFALAEYIKRKSSAPDYWPTLKQLMTEKVRQIEISVSAALDSVLHDAAFTALHAAWLGLKYLLDETSKIPNARIEVYNTTKGSLISNITSPELESWDLYKAAYVERLESFLGDPISLLLTDFSFGPSDEDLGLLEALGELCTHLHCPIVSAASPSFFQVPTFTDLPRIGSLSALHAYRRHPHWNQFRQRSYARYVFLTLPHLAARSKYDLTVAHMVNGSRESLDYCELLPGPGEVSLPALSSGYLLTTCAIISFDCKGWVGSLSPLSSLFMIRTLNSRVAGPITEVTSSFLSGYPIINRIHPELIKLGFVPVVAQKGTSSYAFFACPSCYVQTTENDLGAALLTGRISHTMRALLRHRLADLNANSKLEANLNSWLARFTTASPEENPSDDLPLRDFGLQISTENNTSVFDLAVVPSFSEREWRLHFEMTIRATIAKTVAASAAPSLFNATITVGGKHRS